MTDVVPWLKERLADELAEVNVIVATPVAANRAAVVLEINGRFLAGVVERGRNTIADGLFLHGRASVVNTSREVAMAVYVRLVGEHLSSTP